MAKDRSNELHSAAGVLIMIGIFVQILLLHPTLAAWLITTEIAVAWELVNKYYRKIEPDWWDAGMTSGAAGAILMIIQWFWGPLLG